ncbi:MAG: hypothetical protein H6865_05320 [Rhodospirillales bacterium]|nr:hypothetical protein [Alphaproteobacteria bacterium]MCB9987039.1 hypothetical protein [Rhodospirillales bacterium]USO08192.1 MAG: hypothetical protein H6866_02970 [Rhodospirillales bacterium]
MPIIRQIKTNFTAGEVSRRLLGRGDLRAYENGALTLRNLFIHPTGGVTRRAGMRFVDLAAGPGRLIDFEFNTEQTYLLALSAGQIRIYQDDTLVVTLSAPWSAGQIAALGWTQSADTLLLVHPDVAPKKLTRSGAGVWALSDWTFDADENTGVVYQPMFKFADSTVTLTPSGTSGAITLSASSAVFAAGHAGTRMRVGGKEVAVTAVLSGTVVNASVIQTLSGTAATKEWEEQVFSAVRGYPVSCAFHQDRLIIGGSRDLPNRLWMSRSGELWNFDLGTGLDDEAIEFAILSDQVNAIRNVFSGRHLQCFTSGAEWQVSGDPLTPTTVQLNRQTRVGSIVDRNVPPVDVDGATIFAARSGRELREFVYTDVEQAYQANDLALLAQHIIKDPVDQAFDKRNRLLHLVLADGRIATLTAYRAEQVAAWTLQETQGAALSVAAVGEDVYLLLNRGGVYTIEIFDDTLAVDSGLAGSAETPSATWSGLGHLEGRSVAVVADGVVQPDRTVSSGAITLAAPAGSVQVGLAYTHIVEPLPPNAVAEGGQSRAARLIETVFRIEDTQALRVDMGRGARDIPLRETGTALDTPVEPVSGDIRVRAFGWRQDGTQPLWRIEQTTPLPFTLLSVAADIKTSE